MNKHQPTSAFENENLTNKPTAPEAAETALDMAEAAFETAEAAPEAVKAAPKTDTAQSGGLLLRRIFSLKTLSIVFCAAVISLLLYYIIGPSRGFFHSDCADTLMWGKAAYDGGALLNPDFEYACLLPLGGQLLLLPLIALFGVSMKTQIIGMVLFFLLFTGALFFLFRQMKWGTAGCCLSVGCILLLLSGSDKLREIFWGHIIYYSLGLLYLFVGLGLTFAVIEASRKAARLQTGNAKPTVLLLLLLCWCIAAAVNQLEIVTLCSLPLLAAVLGERFFAFGEKPSRARLRCSAAVIAVCAVAVPIGWLIGGLIAGDIVAGYAGAFSTFDAPNQWFTHLTLFFEHWVTLFGVDIASGDKIADFEGICNLVRLIAAVVLLIAPVAATVAYPKIRDRATRVVILAHWGVTVLVMIGYVFGRLSAANWRLSPILATSAVVTLALCRWVFTALRSRRRLIALALAPLLAAGMLTAADMASFSPTYRQTDGFYNICRSMADNGYTYGYATFWNANAMTVISDSATQCRSVNITDGGIVTPYYYQQERSWFDDQPGQETYFLFLTDTEYRQLSANSELLTRAIKTQTVDGYTILTFDYNFIVR